MQASRLTLNEIDFIDSLLVLSFPEELNAKLKEVDSLIGIDSTESHPFSSSLPTEPRSASYSLTSVSPSLTTRISTGGTRSSLSVIESTHRALQPRRSDCEPCNAASGYAGVHSPPRHTHTWCAFLSETERRSRHSFERGAPHLAHASQSRSQSTCKRTSQACDTSRASSRRRSKRDARRM